MCTLMDVKHIIILSNDNGVITMKNRYDESNKVTILSILLNIGLTIMKKFKLNMMFKFNLMIAQMLKA